MNIEFIAGKRYLRWEALGWEVNDELNLPMGIAVNLSGLYAEYGANEITLIDEIIHTIEHEMIHYCIHLVAPYYDDIDQEEVVDMMQVTPRCMAYLTRVSIPEVEYDWLVGYV